jgi:ribose/xylose/arabinose/galactoside ABC-type transport system permease subunit
MKNQIIEKSDKKGPVITWLRNLAPNAQAGGWRGMLSKRRWVDYVFLAVFILLLLLAASMSDVFFTERNISNLLRQIVTNGLISIGMLVVILTGGIDLSVGSVVAFSAIVVSGMLERQGLPMLVAILIALAVGVLAGLFNGFVISRFKLQPFIVTLASLGAFRGLIYVYSETPITPQDPAFRTLFGTPVFGPFTLSILIMLVAFLVAEFFLSRTTPGALLWPWVETKKLCAWRVSTSGSIPCWRMSFRVSALRWRASC